MIYGYARVSTLEQKLDRQLDEFEKYNVDKVFSDKLSGKNLDRLEYQKLRKLLKSGDLLIISSIDRLGRDYEMVTEEWRYLTKELGVDIFVIDMPILDTRVSDNNLMGKLISDIVLQLLSYVAETEREKTRVRQQAGIKAARKRGVHMGRPKIQLPPNFMAVSKKFYDREIKLVEALELTELKRSTFLKFYYITYPSAKPKPVKYMLSDDVERKIIIDLIRGNCTKTAIVNEHGISFTYLYKLLEQSNLYQKSLKFDKVIKENKVLLKNTKDKKVRKEIRTRIKILNKTNEKYKEDLLK